MVSGIAEAPAAGLGKILMESRFAVPNHQRDYSWTEDKVRQMFDDLEAAQSAGDKTYFIGLMVFMESEGNHLIVLDGQQRLATGIIFASAVRSWLAGYTQYKTEADKIQAAFVGSADIGESKIEARLIMNAANNPTFNKFVVDSVPTPEIKASLSKLKTQDRNRRLLEAALCCRQRIEELAERNNEADKTAKSLMGTIKYLRDSVSVARLLVSSDGAAFTIFETLNDRGMALSPLDLVKNYLFGQAEKKSKESVRDMENRWTQMMATLANVKADNFLKTFWTSRHGRVQKPLLFQNLKKTHNSPDSALDLSTDMLAASEQYTALENADDPVWAPYGKQARRHVRSLRLLGSAQVHPIILAALNKFNTGEIDRLLRFLEVLIVRYQFIGGERTGRLEISCARLAKKISDGKIETAGAAFDELSDIYPKDSEFQDAFNHKTERTNNKAQYLLTAIEREEQRLAGKTVIESFGDLTVEHVLPKNPGDVWSAEIADDDSIMEDCVYMLGNMCLLTSTGNKTAGGAGFDDKKAVYKESDIILTKSIADIDKWNRRAIEHRQAKMAKLAVNIWRFK